MLEKIKNLKGWQKAVIGVISCLLLAFIGMGVGSLMSSKSIPEINAEGLNGLIEKEYTVSDFNDDGVDISANIKMDSISDGDFNNLAKAMYEKALKGKWGHEKIYLNVFTGDIKPFEFHTDGLNATIEIDTEKKVANIGTFTDVPPVKKATSSELVEFKNELVTNNDGKVLITLDMSVEENETSVMAQSLAYTDMVRQLNKVTNVQLKINPNADKSYETHTDFDKLVKSVVKLKLEQ